MYKSKNTQLNKLIFIGSYFDIKQSYMKLHIIQKLHCVLKCHAEGALELMFTEAEGETKAAKLYGNYRLEAPGPAGTWQLQFEPSATIPTFSALTVQHIVRD
jgi:hypothetical protein